MKHPNAEILHGIAEGLPVLARCLPHHPDFDPLCTYSSGALHALINPSEGTSLQGTWEFKLDEVEQC
jgi:hypothetical protein